MPPPLAHPGGERLVACYDGHCGELCAQYCKDHLHETLQDQPTFGNDATVGEALRHRAPTPRPQTSDSRAQTPDPDPTPSPTPAPTRGPTPNPTPALRPPPTTHHPPTTRRGVSADLPAHEHELHRRGCRVGRPRAWRLGHHRCGRRAAGRLAALCARGRLACGAPSAPSTPSAPSAPSPRPCRTLRTLTAPSPRPCHTSSHLAAPSPRPPHPMQVLFSGGGAQPPFAGATAKALTNDHKPEDAEEQKRITAAGGKHSMVRDVPAVAAPECTPPAPPQGGTRRLQAAQHSQGERPAHHRPPHHHLEPASLCRRACRQGLLRPSHRTRRQELPGLRALHRRRTLQDGHAARRAPPLRSRARHARRGVARARARGSLRRARE